MPDATPYLISDLSDGRNGIDAPTSDKFPFTQSAEAQNVDYRYGGVGRKRGGTFDVFAVTTGFPPITPIVNLFRHVATGDETQWQMWSIDTASPSNEQALVAGSAVWALISGGRVKVGGAGGAEGYLQHWVSFNSKLFIFYQDTFADRLKVFDPVSVAERWVGLSVGVVAPTVANQGVGAYPAVQRFYRIRWVTTSFARMSEPTPSVAFTPSGAGLAARVTIPAAPGEGEVAWILEASPDNINFYRVGNPIVVATTFFDDTTLVANYALGPLSEILGTFTLIPSARYGCTDGNRLIMGNFPQTASGTGVAGLESRVMWTPVLGSLDEGDDERIFQTATLKPYLDLDTKNGGGITSVQQINGVVYVFKTRQVWRLTPQDDLYKPYSARRLSSTIGAVSNKSVALGEDAFGNPALYFMSHKGPYRVGASGIEYCGRDIEDLTRTATGLPNINTIATKVIAHSVFHQDLFQWWVWWSSGANNSPDKCCVLDIKKATRQDEYGVRHGWTQVTGLLATAVCSAMGPYVHTGATASLRPWVGLPANAQLGIADRDDIFTDMGTAFQAFVTTRSVAPFGHFLRVGDSEVIVKPHTAAGVTLTETAIRDFSQESSPATVAFTAGEADTTVIRQVNAKGVANAAAVQIKIGDAAAIDSAWEIRQLLIPVQIEGPVSA